MADSSGKWELVSKGKKQKHSEEKKTKNSAKSYAEKASKVENLSPWNDKTQLIEALKANERSPEAKRKNPEPPEKKQAPSGKNNGVTKSQNKKNANKPKQQEQKPAKKQNKQNFDVLLRNINPKELQAFINKLQNKYPNSHLIWLKDVANFLNDSLDVDVADVVYSNKPQGYPLSSMHKEVQNILSRMLKLCSDQQLNGYLDHCMHNLVQNLVHGEPYQGYMICLQVLGLHKPDIIVSSLSKNVQLKSSHHNKQPVCLAISWALGQAGIRDSKAALKVWLEVYLPVVNLKPYTRYALDYLDSFFKIHNDAKAIREVIGQKELTSIIDVVYSEEVDLPPPHKEKLLTLYSQIKSALFSQKGSKLFRPLFQMLKTATNDDMREDLESSLASCIRSDDVQCYKVWTQMHPKCLDSSSFLLRHFYEHWKELSKNLSFRNLRSALESIDDLNKDLQVDDGSAPSLMDCVRYSKLLKSKMSALAMPWRFLVLSMLVALAGFITYDVNFHGSLKSSDTGKFLKNAGMLEVTEQAVSHSIFYFNKAYSWSSENVPYYTDKVVTFTSPYLNKVSAVCYEYSIILWDSTEPLRDYLSTNVPIWLEWLNSNVPIFIINIFHATRYYGERVLWAIAENLLLIWTYVMKYLQTAGTWLQNNVFTGEFSTDKIQEATWKAVGTVQHYSLAAYDWVHQQFTGTAAAWGE